MAHRNFNARLTLLQRQQNSRSSAAETAALSAVITYLDELAARKRSGDPTVQDEIVAVNNYLQSH
jgi:hypothetical protein